jgi:DNA-binding MarR family transcriptional regulator
VRDGRLVHVKPTAAGSRVLDQSRTRRTAYLAKRLSNLDGAELRILDSASAILERLLEDAP